MTVRCTFSLRVKEAIIARQNGLCTLCGQPLVGRIDFDHIRPLGLLGDDASDNLQAIHAEGCHSEKTKADVKRIAKAKRQAGETGQYARRKKNGSKLQSRRKIVSAGFDKRVKRKMSGEVVRLCEMEG